MNKDKPSIENFGSEVFVHFTTNVMLTLWVLLTLHTPRREGYSVCVCVCVCVCVRAHKRADTHVFLHYYMLCDSAQ